MLVTAHLLCQEMPQLPSVCDTIITFVLDFRLHHCCFFFHVCGALPAEPLYYKQDDLYMMEFIIIVSFQTEIEGVKMFTSVRALARHRVIDISMHNYHSAVVVEPGHVYTFGRNTEGQLGTGNTRPQNAIIEV